MEKVRQRWLPALRMAWKGRIPPFQERSHSSFLSPTRPWPLLLQGVRRGGEEAGSKEAVSSLRQFMAYKLGSLRYMSTATLSTTGAVSRVGGADLQRKMAFWLFGCSAWVFSMVVLGGATRLTKSGLSMTDWKFMGGFPPTTAEEWEKEFSKYQQSPEYKRVNKGMNLEDFKFIYWMEYAHRMWGRGLGLFFSAPLCYFFFKGAINQRLGMRLTALLAMGVSQGVIGWWMVKSGLEEPESEFSQPRVSPYRLATHLTSAFAIYSGLLWTGLSLLKQESQSLNAEWLHGNSRLRLVALPVAALVGLTAISGAFVAGNDAGHAFNTFPKMGDNWIPDEVLDMQPLLRNFFENTATVQLDHRILAGVTLLSITGMWLYSRKLHLSPNVSVLMHNVLGMSVLQVTLGISTLLMYVPASLGTAHQAGALTLFTIMLALLHSLKRPQFNPLLKAPIYRASHIHK